MSHIANVVSTKDTSYIREYDSSKAEHHNNTQAYLIHIDGMPAGYIALYNADYLASDMPIGHTPALGVIDFYIEENCYLGKNLGCVIVQTFIYRHASDYSSIFVTINRNNIAAMRCSHEQDLKQYQLATIQPE